ncbi:MAG: 2-amino-4-hydroxy-6-hydroxymethyldihydropteridine diphosphokinase [Vicinamibacterales bacterium]
MNSATVVAIALGSNLGDRRTHLEFAIEHIGLLLDAPRFSSFHETLPEGGTADQPLYLNAAAVGGCRLAPLDVLDELLRIEAARGRVRPFPNAPRTLDLDLILFGQERLDHPRLTIPHPRFRERRFVLEPLREIAPELIDPVSGLSVSALLQRLNRSGAGARG